MRGRLSCGDPAVKTLVPSLRTRRRHAKEGDRGVSGIELTGRKKSEPRPGAEVEEKLSTSRFSRKDAKNAKEISLALRSLRLCVSKNRELLKLGELNRLKEV
jgi:hypothetical protein